jgi:hypothetical protein
MRLGFRFWDMLEPSGNFTDLIYLVLAPLPEEDSRPLAN